MNMLFWGVLAVEKQLSLMHEQEKNNQWCTILFPHNILIYCVKKAHAGPWAAFLDPETECGGWVETGCPKRLDKGLYVFLYGLLFILYLDVMPCCWRVQINLTWLALQAKTEAATYRQWSQVEDCCPRLRGLAGDAGSSQRLEAKAEELRIGWGCTWITGPACRGFSCCWLTKHVGGCCGCTGWLSEAAVGRRGSSWLVMRLYTAKITTYCK